MRTLCTGFGRLWRLDLAYILDKNIGTSARFYAYITEKSHTKSAMYFFDRGWSRYTIDILAQLSDLYRL